MQRHVSGVDAGIDMVNVDVSAQRTAGGLGQVERSSDPQVESAKTSQSVPITIWSRSGHVCSVLAVW